MKIQVASDWHLEFHKDNGHRFIEELNADDVDVLVLAGDLCQARFFGGVDTIFRDLCAKFKNVVYVPGNHEFYMAGVHPDRTWDMLKTVEKLHPNLHILHNEFVEVAGQNFFGGTMWFPPGHLHSIEEMMNDFECITSFKPWVYQEHNRFLFMAAELHPSDVVVTHHLPSLKSIPPKFRLSSLNPFFAVDLDELIKQLKPKLWIHGHTHTNNDYMLDATRIVCNPFGYPHEGKRQYQEKLIIEL